MYIFTCIDYMIHNVNKFPIPVYHRANILHDTCMSSCRFAALITSHRQFWAHPRRRWCQDVWRCPPYYSRMLRVSSECILYQWWYYPEYDLNKDTCTYITWYIYIASCKCNSLYVRLFMSIYYIIHVYLHVDILHDTCIVSFISSCKYLTSWYVYISCQYIT